MVNTRVWIRVSKHGKFPAKSVLKFVLHVQSRYFMKETRKDLCVFEYCDSNSKLVDFQKTLKKYACFSFVTTLKWLRFVDQSSMFLSLALIGS